MKKLTWLPLVLLVILIPLTQIFWQPQAQKLSDRYLYFSKCDTALEYKIGSIDPRFNISPTKLASDLQTAAKLWSNAWNKPLFTPDPKGELTINLVFDERQSLNNQLRAIQGNLEQEKSAITPKIGEYQARVADFKQKLADLNKEISEWNAKGGAPPDVYQSLIQRQKDLQDQATQLNAMARSLNQSTEDYNLDIEKFNQTVDSLNETLVNKPEEGLYSPQEDKIDIYVVSNQSEFVHTLAHELGHALGIDHNPNKASIMYPYTTRSVSLSPQDHQGLAAVCRRQSVLEITGNYLAAVMNYYFQLLSR